MNEQYSPTDDHASLRELVADLGKGILEPVAADYDNNENFNEKLLREFGSQYGLFGITISEEAGGHGLDAVASVIVHEELSRFDPAFTLSYLAHEVLFVNNLFCSGSDAQKQQYLPKALSGEYLCGMAMSEPSAGTDVLGMTTSFEEKEGGFILNGTKQWITNGSCADAFLVYAREKGAGRKEISSFIVDSDLPGFSVGKKEIKMGMKQSPTTQLVFDDVKISSDKLIGKKGGALLHMMRNLEIERVTLAAMSIGIARRALDEMIDYAVNIRESFGSRLSAFGQIQQLIAESYTDYRASRALVYEAAAAINSEKRESLSAAAAKLSATKMAERVSRAAIQVFGGYGYTREYPLERLHRDAILLSIGGGTNEAMQKNIMSDLRAIYLDQS